MTKHNHLHIFEKRNIRWWHGEQVCEYFE